MNNFHNSKTNYIESVIIKVKDLNKMLDFYLKIMKFEVIEKKDNLVSLGVNNKIFLTLEEDKNAIKRDSEGLYHIAYLLKNLDDLASFINHLVKNKYPITGGADHLVSEAIYLDDIEGNGIEVYVDRDSVSWEFDNTEIVMDTLPIDIEKIMNRNIYEWKSFPHDAVVGHVHFSVRNLDGSLKYFRDVLGFDLLLEFRKRALFFSDRKYHHHIGANTFSINLKKREDNELGLVGYKLHIDKEREQELLDNLNKYDFKIINEDNKRYFKDIYNIKVYF